VWSFHINHPQTNLSVYTAPFYRGMTDEQCRLIHCASLEILERTGVMLYYQPCLDLLKKAGCYVEENRVRIPAHLVEWALRTAPGRILVYDRSGKPVMPLEGRISTFGTGSDCLNILDHRTGERRKALLQDVVDGIRVADAMPHIDFVMSMFLPSDVPVAADVRQMEVMLTYSAKPICFVTYEWEGMAEIVEMLEVAVGGAEQLRISPTAILYLNPTTAFCHNDEALRKLMYAAEKRLPVVYLPDVQRGFTCPITYAGAMACANAGQLVGLLLAQLVNGGAPVILNAATPSTIDMKTMVLPYAEPAGKAFSLEMNFYYNLPAFSTGGCSDSKLLDEQAIMEATLSLFNATLRGGNMIHDLGYMESGLTGSLELVVICDEIVSWTKAFLQGLDINEETLALDVIHEHALSGDFLGTEHTLRHVRESWGPRLVDRQNYDKWLERGATSMLTRARTKVDEILNSEPRRILTSEVEERIEAIADNAAANQVI
jgi:trimethylamine--corrinoid protein Co-methyltransferase